jgi:ferric iron reductase protein FhuF
LSRQACCVNFLLTHAHCCGSCKRD